MLGLQKAENEYVLDGSIVKIYIIRHVVLFGATDELLITPNNIAASRNQIDLSS